MASTATTRNRLEKQGTGDNSNTWGTYLNSSIDLIDAALDGRTAFTLSGSKTLTSANYAADESRERFLDITGGTGGTVTIPAVEKWYIVRNNSSGDVVFTTGSGTTQTVASGSLTLLVSDGTNIRKGVDQDYVNNAISSAQFATALPDQTGNADKFIITNGTVASWTDTLPGTPKAPTAAAGTNTTQIATTAFVKTANKMELVATASASGAAAVDFTGLSSDYAFYYLVGKNVVGTVGGGLVLYMRTSTDNGSSFSSGSTDYITGRSYLSGSYSQSIQATSSIELAYLTSSSVTFLEAAIFNCGEAKNCIVQSRGSYMYASLTSTNEQMGIGQRSATTAVNAIRLYASSGNLTGNFYLYGVKAS